MTATIEQQPGETRGRAIAVAVPVICAGIILTAILTVLLAVVGLVIGVVVTAIAVVVRERRFGRSTGRQILESFTTVAADRIATAAGASNLVDGLASSVGVDPPDLRVLDEDACNALVVDEGQGRTTIVVTSGLLASLSRVELEAVVARSLVQLRQGDAAAVVAEIALDRAPDVKVVRSVVGGRSRLDDPDRDVLLDRAAVSVTRYPPGLAGALDACRRGSTVVKGADPATSALWLADPNGRADLDHRIEALGLL